MQHSTFSCFSNGVRLETHFHIPLYSMVFPHLSTYPCSSRLSLSYTLLIQAAYSNHMSRTQEMNLTFLIFLFYFYFYFLFIFTFSIFRTIGLGLEVIGHTVTSVTSDGVIITLITGLKRRFWNKVMSYNMDTTCWPHA